MKNIVKQTFSLKILNHDENTNDTHTRFIIDQVSSHLKDAAQKLKYKSFKIQTVYNGGKEGYLKTEWTNEKSKQALLSKTTNFHAPINEKYDKKYEAYADYTISEGSPPEAFIK